ncbi:MAG TPA: hypothetical protein VEC37_07615 [Bacillota bacterium]|nr:hypothetical protein [Bacillota bacterium]
MKELLIIRSASFQQLDKNIGVIAERFPEHNIHILTHEHGVLLARKYKMIKEIFVYPYRSGFSYWKKTLEIKEKTFDVVIVPVTNLSGAGFFNVLLFSLSIKACQRFCCNVVSELTALSPGGILILGLKNSFFKLIAWLGTVIFAIPIGLFFLLKLKVMEKRGE